MNQISGDSCSACVVGVERERGKGKRESGRRGEWEEVGESCTRTMLRFTVRLKGGNHLPPPPPPPPPTTQLMVEHVTRLGKTRYSHCYCALQITSKCSDNRNNNERQTDRQTKTERERSVLLPIPSQTVLHNTCI